MSILYVSKNLMYYFHYNHIKEKNDHKIKLLFTNTDGQVYDVENKVFTSIKIFLILLNVKIIQKSNWSNER